MKLEKQVCSLELAKKLKELGVKTPSIFHWEMVKGPYRRNGGTWELSSDDRHPDLPDYVCSAFTVAEMGELLPIKFEQSKWEKEFIVRFPVGHDLYRAGIRQFGKTEADARAKMLVYLLENKLI